MSLPRVSNCFLTNHFIISYQQETSQIKVRESAPFYKIGVHKGRVWKPED
jgi:hypothetical protein